MLHGLTKVLPGNMSPLVAPRSALDPFPGGSTSVTVFGLCQPHTMFFHVNRECNFGFPQTEIKHDGHI